MAGHVNRVVVYTNPIKHTYLWGFFLCHGHILSRMTGKAVISVNFLPFIGCYLRVLLKFSDQHCRYLYHPSWFSMIIIKIVKLYMWLIIFCSYVFISSLHMHLWWVCGDSHSMDMVMLLRVGLAHADSCNEAVILTGKVLNRSRPAHSGSEHVTTEHIQSQSANSVFPFRTAREMGRVRLFYDGLILIIPIDYWYWSSDVRRISQGMVVLGQIEWIIWEWCHWQWLGHVCLMPSSSLPRTAIRWTPQGKRNRGRLQEVWGRIVEKHLRSRGLTLDRPPDSSRQS